MARRREIVKEPANRSVLSYIETHGGKIYDLEPLARTLSTDNEHIRNALHELSRFGLVAHVYERDDKNRSNTGYIEAYYLTAYGKLAMDNR